MIKKLLLAFSFLMCPVVLFSIVNYCKSTQSLTASYKVMQKSLEVIRKSLASQ